MTKIALQFGLTLPGQKQYSMVRPEIGIFDLDVDDPNFEETLAKALAKIEVASPLVEEALAQRAADLLGLEVGGAGLATEFAEFRERTRKWQQNVVAEVKKHKLVLDAAIAAGKITFVESDETDEEPSTDQKEE